MAFIFDTSKGETPESIRRKRELVALISGQRRVPQNVGEGMVALGDGIVAGILDRRANRAEEAGIASANEAMNPIMEAFQRQLGSAPTADGSVPMPVGTPSDATAPSSSASFSGSQQEFVDMLMPYAVEASQRTGVDPRIIVAQAAQETGWGRSAPGNNFFGIKSHGKGGGQTFTTHEVIDGKRVKLRDSFRRFENPGDSVAGYADFLLANPRYRPMMAAQGLDAQLDALGKSGYATDPNYANSVGSIARGIRMPGTQVASLDPSAGVPASVPSHPPAVAALDAMANGQPMPPAPQAKSLPLLDDVFDARAGGPPLAGPGAPVAVAENEADVQALEAQMAVQNPTAFAMPQMGLAAKQPRLSTMLPPGPVTTSAFAPEPFVARDPLPIQMDGQQTGSITPPEAAAPQSVPMPAAPAPAAQAAPARAPVQVAQSGSQIDLGLLFKAAQNPFLSQEQRGLVNMLIEQQMQANDPMRRMQLEKAQLEIEALRNPQPKDTDDIREYNYAVSQGYQGSFQQFMTEMKRAGATNVTTNVGGGPDDSELRKKLDGKTGELWATYLEQGANSAALSQDMQVLDELIKIAPQGPLEGRLAEAFPGFSSAGDAFQSIVKRVAPTLRAPGSGSTSDIEYDGMLRSLPALRNRPEANLMIAEIMKAKAAINIERAEIANEYAQGELSAKRARQLMGELDKRSIMSPELKRALEGLGGAPESNAPLEGDVVDGYRFRGGNPGDPSSWEKVE